MKTIKCQNYRVEANKSKFCGKFLAMLPECVIESLRQNPGHKIILRCPGCDSSVRWIEVYYDDGFVIDTSDASIEFTKSMEFDKILNIADNSGDSRISKIFRLRYLDPEGNKVTPWKKIGTKLNLSIQGCINIHNKAIKKIKKQLDKEI